MLVEYVGLFVTGFHTGLLLGLAALAMVDQLYQPQTLLAIVGNLLASGLVFAVLNLLWKRSNRLCLKRKTFNCFTLNMINFICTSESYTIKFLFHCFS